MADIDRDFPDRKRDERVYSVGSGSSTGWWIAGLLALAVLIIGLFAFSGGNPAPVEDTGTAPVTETAPMTEAAPEEGAAAPAEAPAPAAPAETAPAAPADGAAPAAPAEEAAPAQ